MNLLTPQIAATLRTNHDAHRDAQDEGRAEPDPVPVLKLFNPVGAATWIATELAEDGDTLFGLADLGFGCPELGYFSLREIAEVRLPFGLSIERDFHFASDKPLSAWADMARAKGAIFLAEFEFRRDAASKLPRPNRRG
ncbi:DUF2958 domain-containing protein [Novosphingobium sp. G106]|uniref:DUF2958 domain-containing protein n=1 Tax=Novosphingobium sp. G106 TaxID=2849500 RepID=UPI001C2DE024|nr:DUF2958 domain-containing protein [Novosphingobium sp. G106]MBV1687703.1 DUF2958 domain-containing protein [Novosphingobium sp. G106]